MFKKILIANRGDRQRAALVAAQPKRRDGAAGAGDFTARA